MSDNQKSISTNQTNTVDDAVTHSIAQVKQRRSWYRPELSVARIREAASTNTGIDDCGCGSLHS